MRTGRHMGAGRTRVHPRELCPWIIAGIAVALACLHVAVPPNTHAQDAHSEYQVKAAYLFNFLKFVEWPEDAFADPLAPIVIGIVGDDPFGDVLPQVITGKTVQGRDLVIRKYRAGESMRGSHILFINASEKSGFPSCSLVCVDQAF